MHSRPSNQQSSPDCPISNPVQTVQSAIQSRLSNQQSSPDRPISNPVQTVQSAIQSRPSNQLSPSMLVSICEGGLGKNSLRSAGSCDTPSPSPKDPSINSP
ncbi:hypothetical protein ACOMHN_002661 [Nucella lapillus]